MTIADGLIVLATLLSPLIAIQAQKWIERATERRLAQRQVFYDLMATRATRVASKHVEALNRIDLEFSSRRPEEREVINRWRIYADHLNQLVDQQNEAVVRQWLARSDDLFADLLEALSAALRYPFDRVQLLRGIYYPKAHSDAERRREVFEEALIRLLLGHSSLNMRVTEFPFSEEDGDLNRRLQEALLSAVAEDGVVKIRNTQKQKS